MVDMPKHWMTMKVLNYVIDGLGCTEFAASF